MYTVPVPENKFNQQTRDRLGEAVYLLGYLIQQANWETGRLLTTQESIARQTGFPIRTVKRWLQVLADAGELSVRRRIGGTSIQLLDYASCARTRGVKWEQPEVQCAAPSSAAGGPVEVPQMAQHSAADGPSITLQNMNKTQVQNGFENPISSILERKGPEDKPTGRQPGDIFDYTDPWSVKLAEAKEALARLTEQEREELSRDPRPFVRIFVKHDEGGRLVAASEPGAEAVIVRMAEMADSKEQSAGAADS